MKSTTYIILLGVLTLMLSCEKESIAPDHLEVQLGQAFSIELDANWSTGYQWQWVNGQEISVVESRGITYQPKGSLLGAPGKEKWIFKSILRGEETLRFEYRSPHGGDSPALVSREILIHVF